ncbi:MBL fold metallo-hydrolase [Anaerococcus vaginalis]|uniref:MBL fold metallo-hydrolase n=1 Tax=Anaerococcus vaginalis TaxID=33037 RepID=UPI002903B6A5|nr:MBL fold metallo-hydrolase [Anaerococcus vaginalis]MDU2648341.1 MBL fold metallo-hydrolase [Anaerococcus vaginalis]
MKIEVLGTGSSGNCYKVKIGKATLLLECGLPYKVIQKKLNFKISEIDACLVTHEHMDHAKAIKDLMKAGVDCYMTKGTAEALGINGHRLKTFRPFEKARYYSEVLKNLIIVPFEAVHDVAEPVSYFIKTRDDKESLVFVTDTAYLKYKIPECDVLMIECNYVKAKLDENVRLGNINTNLRNRIVKNHLSLESLVEALRAASLDRCKKIYLLHLSDGNSDEKLIKRTIQETTGIEVVVC